MVVSYIIQWGFPHLALLLLDVLFEVIYASSEIFGIVILKRKLY